VLVTNLRSNEGVVRCAIYRGAEGFPGEHARAVQSRVVRIRARRAVCAFRDLPPGDYAAAAIHDEDNDRELDRSLFGAPTEGWGVSNNAPPRPMGPPTYHSAEFHYDGAPRRLSIRLRY
jgi:uncharacterized protein (DUF2141 family)